MCPLATFCNCTDCFFGDRCQFYANGIELTLDDILRYDIRPNATSILCILTFRVRESREVGCGMYLLASYITSLLTIAMFTAKFWFLILTQVNPTISRLLEFILKVFLYTDNWFNACVALERLVIVYKGVYFKKQTYCTNPDNLFAINYYDIYDSRTVVSRIIRR
ncbi:unnamed protein product [Adineta ricciae]|uniref:Uncharacterized protein n=1 Tax=Adineta ricciae TaxID=249248 RepID=A0A815K1M2_ADIRI|nr:unnamed protein product [Adineta ricciae]CAF1389600.1 unnamed protein product [Adineta ricciae]